MGDFFNVFPSKPNLEPTEPRTYRTSSLSSKTKPRTYRTSKNRTEPQTKPGWTQHYALLFHAIISFVRCPSTKANILLWQII